MFKIILMTLSLVVACASDGEPQEAEAEQALFPSCNFYGAYAECCLSGQWWNLGGYPDTCTYCGSSGCWCEGTFC